MMSTGLTIGGLYGLMRLVAARPPEAELFEGRTGPRDDGER